MSEHKFERQLYAYARGELPDAEASALETAIQADPQLRERFRQAVQALLLEGVMGHEPPPVSRPATEDQARQFEAFRAYARRLRQARYQVLSWPDRDEFQRLMSGEISSTAVRLLGLDSRDQFAETSTVVAVDSERRLRLQIPSDWLQRTELDSVTLDTIQLCQFEFPQFVPLRAKLNWDALAVHPVVERRVPEADSRDAERAQPSRTISLAGSNDLALRDQAADLDLQVVPSATVPELVLSPPTASATSLSFYVTVPDLSGCGMDRLVAELEYQNNRGAPQRVTQLVKLHQYRNKWGSDLQKFSAPQNAHMRRVSLALRPLGPDDLCLLDPADWHDFLSEAVQWPLMSHDTEDGYAFALHDSPTLLGLAQDVNTIWVLNWLPRKEVA